MDKYTCRMCRSEDHLLILDYGPVALAGGLLSSLEEAENEERYPLTLVFCEDCKHVQIREILDPSILFSNYAWETGVGTSIMKYCPNIIPCPMIPMHMLPAKFHWHIPDGFPGE